MKVKVLPLVIVAGIGFYFVSKAKKIKDLKFSFLNVSDKKLKGLNLTGNLNYTVENPTSETIVIQFFRGKIYYGSFPLSNIEINQVILKAGESKTLSVNFKSSLLLLGYDLQAIIESGWYLYQFHVTGDLIYKVGNMPQITVKLDTDLPIAEKYEKNKTP